ncbi:MAG: PIN domain-containing protein [Candidatus Dormibacteraeota bacterium]|nr:PIN domain-containing protein [Candidatus Dormibacteraeota bacterium]
MALLLDTSGVIALLDRHDDGHAACIVVAAAEDALIVPPMTLVEIDYWCRKRGAAAAFSQFSRDIAQGAYEMATWTTADLARAVEIADRYGDLDLGIVDASIVALAERLAITRVLTLDRRDFSVVRPRHCRALTLLPS